MLFAAIKIFAKLLNRGLKILSIATLFFLVIIFVINLFVASIKGDVKRQTISTEEMLKRNSVSINKILYAENKSQTNEEKAYLGGLRIMTCLFIGEGCSKNPLAAEQYYRKSIAGGVGKLITLAYSNPTASSVYWVSDTLQKSGFIPKTYAAEGIGFTSLRPYMNLWKMFRNISMMLLVVVLIVMGFMIMFRMKLNPQTVITVENALPRITISLILITFSFPIAGFLIDLMYVLIMIIISILSNNNNFFTASDFQNLYINGDMGTIFGGLTPGGLVPSLSALSEAILNLIPAALEVIIRLLLGGVVAYILFPKINDFLGNLFQIIDNGGIPIISGLVGGAKAVIYGVSLITITLGVFYVVSRIALPLLLFLLVFTTVVFVLFRIFFLLFSSYLKIFLLVVFSPFFMLFEALPGKGGFANWFKMLLSEVLVFPIVIALFVVSYLILNMQSAIGTAWRPPFLTAVDPNALTVLLAMGIVFMIPDLVKVVKQAMGVKDMPIGLSLGTYFAGVGAAVGGFSSATGFATSAAFFPGIGNLIRKTDLWTKLGDKGIIPPSQATLTGEAAAKEMSEILKKAGVIPRK